MNGIMPARPGSAAMFNPWQSSGTDTTCKYSVPGGERLGRGAMAFTGPHGIRDHRVRVQNEHRYVGEGTMSPEGTSEVAYLWRAPKKMPHPRPKTACVGEIGWGVPEHSDWNLPQSGMQIQLGEFRQAVEDRHTHMLLNPWYPTESLRMLQNENNGQRGDTKSATSLRTRPQTTDTDPPTQSTE